MMRSMPEAIYSRDTNLFRAYLEENLAEGRLKGFEANLLREVCKQGKPHHLSLLIEKGWDINMCLGHGESSMDNGWTGDDATALHYAAQIGNDELVKALLDAGADVNARDADGATPILTTWMYGHITTVQILVEHGADINAKNKAGETALLHWAQDRSDDYEIGYFLEHGADGNGQDDQGRTVVWFLANSQKAKLADAVLALGVSLDFWSAVMLGKIEAVKATLQEDPALLESADTRGWTPLVNAVTKNQRDMVEFFLRLGADPNHHEGKKIALIEAVLNDQLEIVMLLVYAGAHVNIRIPKGALLGFKKSKYGYDTPFAASEDTTLPGLARSEGFEELAHFLTLAGAR